MRRILYARYGMEMGGEIGRFIPGSGTVFEVAGAIGGHSAAGLQTENKCRLSLRESSVSPYFRGAKGDNKS